MSDRRKLPVSRKILSYLPAATRFALIRSKINLAYEIDSRFEFRIAQTKEELSEAYRILHDSYVEQGFSKEESSGMRIVKYFALPSTTTLIALYDKKVVGTISIIRRNSFGLPLEACFNLSACLDKNEVVAEVSALAIDSKFRLQRGAVFLPLLKYFWQYVREYMKLDSIVIMVNPSMSDFYEAFFGFTRLKDAVVKEYSFANGKPGVGLYYNIHKAPDILRKLYGNKPKEKNVYTYFYGPSLPNFVWPQRDFYKCTDPVMTPDMLQYFFGDKSKVLQDLTFNERLGLAANYPSKQYRQLILAEASEFHRDQTRYLSNMKGVIPSHGNLSLSVLDVASRGLCVSSTEDLSGLVRIQVEISKGRFAELRGQVKWRGKNQIHGIQILKSDSQWAEFIYYLASDFNSLVNGRTNEAS